MNFFLKAITAVTLLLTAPATSMMHINRGTFGYEVPVQDHKLWFSCSGVKYENEYLFRVLHHAYPRIHSDSSYPVPIDRVIYKRRPEYYLFPLLTNGEIYDLGIFTFLKYYTIASQLKSHTRYSSKPLFGIQC
ncbi:CSEP0203 putative effector protein [Blumeria hordei DH14]|uniref:CSEP0203 putative effector protein n=1 Tax=Blumeria graminis f. sp. hordei (strain DH14) TaxID=546991 RepID=N1J953_BLUG1|nr:CSEP0203 putative effector protein [Blumeria hordei DH14]